MTTYGLTGAIFCGLIRRVRWKCGLGESVVLFKVHQSIKQPSKYFPRERRVYKVSHNSWFLSARRQLQKWGPKQIQTKRSENPRGAAAGSWRPDPGLRQRGDTFKCYTIWSKKYRLLNKTDTVLFFIINLYNSEIWRIQQIYMYFA